LRSLRIEFQNGSRIVALPGESDVTIRGYSQVRLLVIDEAARVDVSLYTAVRPMLSVSGGRLVCLSTPFGRAGWFFTEWSSGQDWDRTKIVARQCPRISKQFLSEEKRHMGDLAYREEYECEFVETRSQFLSDSQIESIFRP
jgi:hypothetical protein